MDELMAMAVMGRRANPGDWLIAVREIVERAGLRPERCIPLGGCTLSVVCAAVADEARKQGKTALTKLEAAIEAFR